MERQRQREWEQRRKEELLNQKGMEEDIVTGLKLRLEKLKGELTQEVIVSQNVIFNRHRPGFVRVCKGVKDFVVEHN